MAIQSGAVFVASRTLIRIISSGLIARAQQLFRQSLFFYLLRLFSKQKSLEVFFLHLLKQRERKNDLLKQRYSDCDKAGSDKAGTEKAGTEKAETEKAGTEKAGTENICNFRKVVTNAFSNCNFSKVFSLTSVRQKALLSVCRCAFSGLKNFLTPAVNHFNSRIWKSPHKTALHRL